MNGAPGRLQVGQLAAGRYPVAALIGSGEIAEVYDVRDPSSGRAFALKLFPQHLMQHQNAWLGFQQAAQLASSLAVDAIAKSFDFGVEPTVGGPFAINELVTSPSLFHDVLTTGALGPRTLAELLGALAPAFDRAHAAGLVHRALKPQNVFLAPAGTPGSSARVTDFGASLIWAAIPPPPGWPASPGWLAPEAANAHAPSAPTMDVFALGLVAFFALTARPIFMAMQQRPPDTNQLWAELTNPLPPASRRAAELGVALPAALDPWFERALTLNPAARFQSVGEMASALWALVGAAPVQPSAALEPPAEQQSPARYGQRGTLFIDQVDEPAAPAQVAPQAIAAPAPPAQAFAAPPAPPAPYYAPQPTANAAPGPAASDAYPGDDLDVAGVPKKGGLLIPLLVVGALLGLSAVALGAWMIVGRARGAPGATASSATTATAVSASGSAPVSASRSAATAPESATPPASGAPAPTREPDAGAAAAASDALVTFKCDPGCDDVKCDAKIVEHVADGVRLAAGKHTCTAAKPGYVAHVDTFVVQAGEDVERSIVLAKVRTGTVSAPPKKCGTFLNPCK